MNEIRRVSGIIIIVLSLFPLVWVAGVVTFAFRARNYLGYWPSPYHPDPKEIPFDVHHSVLGAGVYANFWIAAFALLAFIFRNRLRSVLSPSAIRAAGVTFGIGWFLIVLLFIVPGINFVEWYLD